MSILFLPHNSIWTNHISSTPWPHVAGSYYIGWHGSYLNHSQRFLWLTVLFEKGRYLKVLKLGDSVRIGPACNLSPILNIRYFENTDQKSTITRAPLPTKVRLVKAMVFPIVIYGCESWTIQKAECWRIEVLSCGIGEDSWEPLGLQGDTTSQS